VDIERLVCDEKVVAECEEVRSVEISLDERADVMIRVDGKVYCAFDYVGIECDDVAEIFDRSVLDFQAG